MTQTKAILDVFDTSAAKRPASLHDKTAAAARQITDDARDAGVDISDAFYKTT